MYGNFIFQGGVNSVFHRYGKTAFQNYVKTIFRRGVDFSCYFQKVKGARTISIEPLPNTYNKLIDNININQLNNVIPLNIGISNEETELFFTTDKDTMNSVATKNDKNIKKVKVDTIDNISKKYGIPKVMKIDVEGYEKFVLEGAENTLEEDTLEIVIVELNGSSKKFGINEEDIHNYLINKNFISCTYEPFKRKLIRLSTHTTENTIYVKRSKILNVEQVLQQSKTIVVNRVEL